VVDDLAFGYDDSGRWTFTTFDRDDVAIHAQYAGPSLVATQLFREASTGLGTSWVSREVIYDGAGRTRGVHHEVGASGQRHAHARSYLSDGRLAAEWSGWEGESTSRARVPSYNGLGHLSGLTELGGWNEETADMLVRDAPTQLQPSETLSTLGPFAGAIVPRGFQRDVFGTLEAEVHERSSPSVAWEATIVGPGAPPSEFNAAPATWDGFGRLATFGPIQGATWDPNHRLHTVTMNTGGDPLEVRIYRDADDRVVLEELSTPTTVEDVHYVNFGAELLAEWFSNGWERRWWTTPWLDRPSGLAIDCSVRAHRPAGRLWRRREWAGLLCRCRG